MKAACELLGDERCCQRFGCPTAGLLCRPVGLGGCGEGSSWASTLRRMDGIMSLPFCVLMATCSWRRRGRGRWPYLRKTEAEVREAGWFVSDLTAGMTLGLQTLSPGTYSSAAFRNKVWEK